MYAKLSALMSALMFLFAGVAFAATITVEDGQSIQDAVHKAVPGDTVLVRPGTYKETVFVDKNDITLTGVIEEGAWPTLEGEFELNDGFLIAGHGVTVENFYIKSYKGNGIMTQGANDFKILNNVIDESGVYGIFPEFGVNGLVAYNVMWGIEDAAIYVGQCENVDVIYNETFDSVMGIEIENSSNILVEANAAYDNSAGIVVTLLPGLPVKKAENTIIRNNFVMNNNTKNFAPEGSLAAGAPAGTGIFVFAADGTVIENNIIRNNDSVGIAVVDHSFMPGAGDPKMDPNPDGIRILGNLFHNNGTAPKDSVKVTLEAAGIPHGLDVLAPGPGAGSCLSGRSSLRHLVTEAWSDCDATLTSFGAATMQLAEDVVAPEIDPANLGSRTYAAVCSGCHAFERVLIGPPMSEIKTLYAGKADVMAEWITMAEKKRADYPEMPPQGYLSDKTRLAVSEYILNDLTD